jgi:hypothetical protein
MKTFGGLDSGNSIGSRNETGPLSLGFSMLLALVWQAKIPGTLTNFSNEL